MSLYRSVYTVKRGESTKEETNTKGASDPLVLELLTVRQENIPEALPHLPPFSMIFTASAASEIKTKFLTLASNAFHSLV